MARAGLSRAEVYLTNAVKHFKFEERGKRRIHARPNAAETRACRPWLFAELESVRPRVIVALGATASRSLATIPEAAPFARIATIHPSAALRAPDHEARQGSFAIAWPATCGARDARAQSRSSASTRLSRFT